MIPDKAKFANPLGNQVFSLPDMIEEQVKACFSAETLEAVMSMEEIFNVRNIYITGCGDSIAAAGAFAHVIKRLTGVFHCKVAEPMEFSRFMTKEEIGSGEPDSPLVIAISAGGGTARICEILQKANEMGAFSLLITNNGQSAAAGVAKRVFCLNTPKMEQDFPGLRSYLASMVGLIALAVRIGRVKNILPPGAEGEFQQAVCRYVQSYRPMMEQMDDQMFTLAQMWKDFELFHFVGDGPGLSSALFSLEKFIEVAGVMGEYDDSEDWCHIGYHVKDPERIGTVIFADRTSPSFGRIRETVGAAAGIGRPVLVITNEQDGGFPEDVHVCRIPAPPETYGFLTPLMDYGPAAVLAGYCAVLGGRKFFNEYDVTARVYNGGGIFMNPDIMTMKNSKIEIHL